MSFDIETTELKSEFEDLSREEADEAARRWYSASVETLEEAGDEHEWDTFPVANQSLPPTWDDSRGGYVFDFHHPAAIFFEDGTDPHEIEAVHADMLAFEWPDAPDWVREAFEDTYPTVFFKKVSHPGTPALKYIERGRQEAVAWLEGR